MAARILALAFLIALAPTSAGADEPPVPRLVVFELQVVGKVISLDTGATLTAMVRQRIVGAIGSRGKLLSKDKVIEIMRQSGKPAVECTGECEVQTARVVGAEYSVSGEVSPLGSNVVLVLDVKRSRDGVTVASKRLKAPPTDLDDKLDATVDALAAEWLASLGDGGGRPAAEKPAKPVDQRPLLPQVACPSGTSWNGTACLGTLACPNGSTWDGQKCVLKAEVVCPEGSRLDGSKCVGSVPSSAQPGDVCEGKAGQAGACERLCASGQAYACANLGLLCENGQGVPQDKARAAGFYKLGCDGGIKNGCANLGHLYESGQGVLQDKARAAGLYNQGCDGGSASGCANLAFLYSTGQGVLQDKARAAGLYKQGCDGGNAGGCANLGDLYSSGQGVPQDKARAAGLYKQGCDGGSATGCTNLGDLYENGQGVPQDKARAAGLYKQGCDGGYQWGCERLKELQAK